MFDVGDVGHEQLVEAGLHGGQGLRGEAVMGTPNIKRFMATHDGKSKRNSLADGQELLGARGVSELETVSPEGGYLGEGEIDQLATGGRARCQFLPDRLLCL